MHDQKIVEGIKESFPHLESQIDIILNIFGERRQKTYGSLFVYGQPGTGVHTWWMFGFSFLFALK